MPDDGNRHPWSIRPESRSESIGDRASPRPQATPPEALAIRSDIWTGRPGQWTTSRGVISGVAKFRRKSPVFRELLASAWFVKATQPA